MEILAASKRLNLPNYGLLQIEDFVPISKKRVLVTAGKNIRRLIFILEVDWDLRNPVHLKVGKYLRLGHMYNKELIYSDGWKSFHQPFKHSTGLYETNDAPNGRIYKDKKLFIDCWKEMAEIGNPWISEDLIFFEGRENDHSAPEGWWIYCADLNGKNIRKLIKGANPCIFNEKLYYGKWEKNGFSITATDKQSLLSANP